MALQFSKIEAIKFGDFEVTPQVDKEQRLRVKALRKKLDEATRMNLLLKNELLEIRQDLDDNNLRTMRLDFDRAIDTDPDNVIVIMDMVHKYFVDMHGNCYMSKKFQERVNKHNVNMFVKLTHMRISFYIKCLTFKLRCAIIVTIIWTFKKRNQSNIDVLLRLV